MIGATLHNRYRIDAELGRGGMGVVYRAYDALLDRAVAVKVLSDSGLGTEGRARLLREAQAAARLDHPNIVSVYDAGETGDTPFIVMQLVTGTTLRDCGPLSIPQIVVVARQLCDALDHAHAQGIVHRDLKPENISVVGSGERLIAKLMDFGLARSREASRLTQEDALVGTVFYLAPEQALGQEVDGRADLYALGMILYELATGRLPFTGDDPLIIISQHLHAPVVPPRTHNPEIPPGLESLILRLLSKKPDDRPASAREVLEALTLDQAQSPALPGGEVTFLFTDIEGSTPLWERDPDGMRASLAQHDAILHEVIATHSGRVFNVIGDAFLAAFSSPVQAAAAALAAQRRLASAAWGATGPLRVRMGLHRGPAEVFGRGYAPSHTLNRVARVMSAGHGGQILLSLAVAEVVREHLPEGVGLRDLGKHRLKGLSQAEHLFQIAVSDLRADFPPLKSMPVAPSPGGEVASLLDRIVRGQLVGRKEELAEAVALWQRAAVSEAGEARVLLVSGEPGVGKTRFVRELIAQAHSSGATVLVGECYAESGAPYAPIAQMIRQALDDPSGGDLGLSEFALADLLTLAPGLRPRYPNISSNPPLDAQSELERVYDSIVELCARLAARRRSPGRGVGDGPLLLFVDDAHWADPGTLFLLRHLARRGRATLRRANLPLLLVMTYREVELDEARALHEVLLDLNRERLAARIKLARLSKQQTRDLLAVMFAEEITPEFLDGIYRETEGNPFFVEEVCKALVESGKLYFADGRWHRPPNMAEMEIPQSVRLAIQARVGKLPERTQDVLRLAAILGREFDFETLLRAGDQDEEALIEALEAAGRAQLVEEVKGRGGEVYAFVHVLISTTLREGVSSRRRRRLHQRAAKAIEVLRPDDDEALAHHFAAADELDKAIEYSRRAARRAEAVYAYDQAIRHLRAALEMLDPREQAETRLAVLEQLSDVHNRLREGTQAIPLYQEALDLWRVVAPADKIMAVRLHRKVVEAVNRVARFADFQQLEGASRASGEAGLKLAEGAPPHLEVVRLLTALSYDAWIHRAPMDWEAAERYARAAVGMAEQLDVPVELSAALDALASVYGARGLFRERVQVALRRLVLSQEPRFGDLRERVNILHQAGAALIYVGEYVQAMPHLLEAEKLASQIQDVDQHVAALRYQSYCWYKLDRWDGVLAIEEKWRALEKRYPDFFGRVGAMCFQIALNAGVYARRGEFERAATLREESRALMVASTGPLERWARDNHY
jgi:class 3 adenylate cyclase/tetratricopeptide (TPR) repeat protein